MTTGNAAAGAYTDTVTFTASVEDAVNFYNSKENTCYFCISIVLRTDDGTGTDKPAGGEKAEETEKTTGVNETEEVLWTSKLIEPEEEIKVTGAVYDKSTSTWTL